MDIDFLKIKKHILNIIVLLLAFIISFNIYKTQTKKVNSLRAQQKTEEKRNELLKSIKQLQAAFNSYKDTFEKKDVSLVITNITKDSDIKIISLKPGEEGDYSQIMTRYPLGLRIEAPSYHLLGKFISRIENDGKIHSVVENIKISPAGERMNIDLTLSTFFFKAK